MKASECECNEPTIQLPATASCGMTEVINLRTARKRAARDKAERGGAENRIAFGVSKLQRKRVATERDSSRRILDQHKIETGDRR